MPIDGEGTEEVVTDETPAPEAGQETKDNTDATDLPKPSEETEGKTLLDTSDKGAEGSEKGEGEKDDASESKAPEAYEDFTTPEGVDFKGEVTTEFKALAKDMNLSQDQAQKLADLGSKQAEEFAVIQAQQWQDVRTEWVKELKADPDVGGTKFEESQQLAHRALKQFGSPELNKFLSETGYGDSAPLFKMLVNVAKATSEDSTVKGEAATGIKSTADTFYDE